MFNPDFPNEKKEINKPLPVAPVPQRLLSDYEKLRFYIMEGGMAEAYGFRVVKGMLEIKDLSKIERYPGDFKEMLREIYRAHRNPLAPKEAS